MKVGGITAKNPIQAGTKGMKMLNVIPVAAIVLSCTMISFPISSAEGRGVGGQGGGVGGGVGFSGGGGRGGGGGGVASRGGAMAARGGLGGAQGAMAGSRSAVIGNRGAFAGNRGAFAGNRNAAFGNRATFTGNRNGFIRNQGSFVGGARGGGVSVRRAQPISPGNTGFVGAQAVPGVVGAQAVSQGAFAANPALVGGGFQAQAQNFGGNQQFDGRFNRGFDQSFDGRFDNRFDRGRFDRNRNDNVRRAIPLYYYGFNFYPSYGFNINDFSPVTVDDNGRPFDRRFVRSNEAVRVPGAILPVNRAPLTVDVQLALRNRGFYGGPIDGVIGSQSRGAIRAFQYANGLPVNGQIDSRFSTVLMRGF